MLKYIALPTLLFSALSPVLSAAEPLKALLIAGGCCHDYAKQQEILSTGIQARANVQVDVIWTDDKGTTPKFPIYDKADWSKGYDVVIHDECAASVSDLPFVQNIIRAHEKVPAVNLHCAMHSYRTGKDDWFKYLGLQSASHNWQKPISLRVVDPKHPIMEGATDWTTINEELYNNINLFGAHPLLMGSQVQKGKDGVEAPVEYVVAWTNDYKGTRIFSTTIGHNNETVADARYLDLVTRGLLWACGKLTPEYQTPFKGKNVVTFIKSTAMPQQPKAAEAKAKAAALKPAPAGATLVKVTASSEESGKGNYAWFAVDGDKGTRWCANGPGGPQWLQLEFEKPQELTSMKIAWEQQRAYKHKVEGSADGKAWSVLADDSTAPKAGDSEHTFAAKDIRFVKINYSADQAGWGSIREVTLKGPNIKSIYPKLDIKQAQAIEKAAKADADPLKNEGNIKPEIVKLTPEQEKQILADVKVPEGFDVTLFANPKAANYPVYVAAAPNGDVYVSSDGNGSLGRNPHRGRIIRLRDSDGDGRADEVKEFVKDVDSPRGLVWDNDRLYLIHPPDISVYIDHNGDGVSDEQKTLIKGIAFGFADRPADHTTNGLSLGIDGWLYIAGGDFGFLDAVGTDGKHLQHRGGGVIRFRPDGSGIELFADGTRNILGTPISPLLDIFARDNTNDGGGWDIRFHHFTGLEDHGYPRMFKNFGDEHIQPLNIYGGGSGCGSVYLSEPGFPKEWNDAPMTCDWGTGALWKHSVERKGATFIESKLPEKFIAMTRPTDADVDALSHVYQASWKGATFNWEGPDVGYIVRVSPKDYKAEALPDFNKASDAELIALLSSPSQVRAMEAQRALLRREPSESMTKALVAVASDSAKPLAGRVAAVYTISQRALKADAAAATISTLAPLASDATLQPFVLRALGDAGLDKLAAKQSTAPAEVLAAGLKSSDARTKLEAIVATSRQHLQSIAPQVAALLGDADPIIAHTAFRGLAWMNASAACFAVVDNYDAPAAQRRGALLALMRMHTPEVVQGLIDRLAKESGTEARKGLLAALCRLHFADGEWKGDSWGTRPDTRGPYYQPDPWSETAKVAEALKAALGKAPPDEAGFLVGELNRNRIQFNEALERILTLAKADATLVPELAAQLATADAIPAAAVPLLAAAAQSSHLAPRDEPSAKPSPNANATPSPTLVSPSETATLSAAALANIIICITKTDNAEAWAAALNALVALDSAKGSGKEQEAGRKAFFDAPKLENVHQALEAEAAKVGTPTAVIAEAALLSLAARTNGSPEAREMSKKALEAGWAADAKRRQQIINAAVKAKSHAMDDKILAAVTDSDPQVVNAAKNAVKSLKLSSKNDDKSAKVSSLKPEEVVAQVVKMKGDAALGEQLFTRLTCVACHTTSQDQAPKGPYLGNIAQTYKRPDLAMNILDPNKTIAQGFASEVITLKDGTAQMGFITLESADTVKLRNVAAQEFSFKVSEIAKRDKLPMSIMPPGLVSGLSLKEFASLLDYLEALSAKK